MMDAEMVIMELCRVLLGNGPNGAPDRGLMSHIVRGEQHIERCQAGMWLTPGGPRPDGDPCSARCMAAHAALKLAEQWLRANESER